MRLYVGSAISEIFKLFSFNCSTKYRHTVN